MTSSLAQRLAFAAGALFVGACSSSPPAPPAPARPHLHTATVSITKDALLPSPQVRMPAMSTVVFRNRTDQPFAVTIDGAVCQRCDTVLGFAPADAGARCDAGTPRGITTLCFHEPGTFAFTVTVGDRELTGTIEVTR